ncbi:uncharacterized protein LOC135707006 [Ochlerotatus camptorhynchus]|uniref:uncharacterized protein LOC135707006 n=1 Tax=Ochlerotatus camptorhynchus TaxID=644619 RepID=UPI0031D4859B
MAMSKEAMEAKRLEYDVRGNYLISSVAAIETFLESYDANLHAGQVQVRLEKLECFYNQYVEVIIQLQLLPSSEPAVEYETQLFSFEAQYYELKAQLARLLERKPLNVPSTSRRNTPLTNHIKYPELKLPEFSGNPLGWRSFHDLYNAAVHSSGELSSSEKFQYLKSILRGEAAGLIAEIPISDENYAEAWKRLVNRYDNKRILVKCHLAELFDTPPMKQESAEGLLNLVDRFDRNIAILKKLGEPTDTWSTILVYQLSLRLDQNTLREWENHIVRNVIAKEEPQNNQMLKYSDMVMFLQGHARVLQALAPNLGRSREVKVKSLPKHSTLHVAQSSSGETTGGRKCLQCGSDHFLYQCFKFRKLSPRQRFDFVKQHHLCLNCMKTTSHGCKDCSSDGCRKCKKRHHTLIHLQPLESNCSALSSNTNSSQQSSPASTCPPDSALNHPTPGPSGSNSTSTLVSVHQSALVPVAHLSTSPQPQSNPPAALVAHSAKLPNETVLLCTALVNFEDNCGAQVVARVLLDSCSQFNLMTESLHQRLNLQVSPEHVNLGGVGQLVTPISKAVETTISSRISAFEKKLKFLVLKTISCDQPVHTITTVDWEIPNWITLADPTFSTPGPVDALLGAGTFFELLRYGRITLGERLPLLQSTILGWIVSGECSNQSASPIQSCFLTQNQKLEQLVARFWDLEQCSPTNCWSPTEKECERHFLANVFRNEEGRYQVRLPVKKELLLRLQNNKHNAMRRFLALERKLNANPTLRAQYEEFINEYLRLGHMREIPQEELAAENDDVPQFYLPHHAILRPDSTTTKLRIVFDASCKSCSGLSLNDVLLTGPTIQDTINAIVLRFRMPAFVIMGDLCKMYRQILKHPLDQRLLRIYWRKNSAEPVKVFQLLTVTYGTSSAPFLATRVLQQLAEDEQHRFPLAAVVIRKDMYMDDLLTGCDDLEKLR